MEPPRLTVVQSTGDEEPRDDAREADGHRCGEAANDAAPAGEHAATGSPVHDLIASIESGTAEQTAAPAAAERDAGTAPPGDEVAHPTPDPQATARKEKLRIVEAVLFAAPSPLDEAQLATHLKPGDDLPALLSELQADYAGRGVNLVRTAGKWAFRTADDLSWVLERHTSEERRLSRAALETLAIVAYHQPVTRAEIEEIRGVTISKGTLDVLMETGWVRPRGRRRAPGKPITYGTTPAFLDHFGLDGVKDLPGLAELKGAGLLDANLPPDFKVPTPTDVAALMPDELPLEAGGDDEAEAQAELELDEPTDEGEEADDAPAEDSKVGVVGGDGEDR